MSCHACGKNFLLVCLGLSLAVLGGLWVDACALRGPLSHRLMRALSLGDDGEPVAEVGGQLVTKRDLSEALREALWESGGSWAEMDEATRKRLRAETLERLIDDRLIRAFRIQEGVKHPPRRFAAQKEAALHRKQFANETEIPQRLAAQGHSARKWVDEIHEIQLDEAWLRERMEQHAAKVTEDAMRAWYAQHRESLRIPEAYHVAHLFLSRHDPTKADREAEMQAIHRRLISQEQTFASLVLEHSEDQRTRKLGGDLGWLTAARMPADFMAAVRTLRVGECSAPVATKLGWHLLVVLEKRAAQTPSYEAVQDEIRAKLESQQREEALRHLLKTLRERTQQASPPLIYHARRVDLVVPAS